jgi:exopolyphosphatase/pppGpp-phosphohydrolase
MSRLEAAGVMRQMQQRLAEDTELRAAYQAAHRDYLARRAEAARAAGVPPLPPGTQSAGGMPDRVKCLHALAAHELAVPGANPLGREAVALAGSWWQAGPCVVVADQPSEASDLLAGAPLARRSARGGRQLRVAAIDCGTNSVRLLVADVDRAAGRLFDVDRRLEIVRLGQGVDATGRLAADALARTLQVLRSYRQIIEEASASAVRMVATSATRDAANAGEFVAGVRDILAIEPEVLSGEDEARLSFTGATAELVGEEAGPYLVTDIGGGSTEFVLGDPGTVPAGVSVNIGCVRMTERHLHHDPPGDREIAAARADIDAALDEVARQIPVADARILVGLAGSVTTVAALVLGLDSYRPEKIHHSRVSAEAVRAVTASLLAQTRAERARMAVMHPGRVDVIGGGALVLTEIMERFGFGEVLVSEHDILDGLAWSLAPGTDR